MTLQQHTRKTNGKHKSREQYSLPAERVAETQKRKGCALWTHVSGGKGKEESRQNDGGVHASTGKVENVHRKTRNGQREKGSKADKPPNRGSPRENHSVLLYCIYDMI